MSHYKKHHIKKSIYGYSSNTNKHTIGIVISLISLGVIIVLAGLVQSNVLVLPTNFIAAVKGAPRLSVERDTIDHGDLQLGSSVETVFTLRNIGDQDLDILSEPIVQVVEGCCPPSAQVSSSVIHPGQTATISLRYTMHDSMGGNHRFNIHLRTNDPQAPEKILVALSNWI